MSAEPLSAEAVAARAGVEVGFVRRALEAGALGEPARTAFTAEDAARLRFLHAWDAAGLAVEAVGGLVTRGELPFSFLQVPSLRAEARLDSTYADLAAVAGIDLRTVQQLHESLGFDAPAASERISDTDRVLVDLLRFLVSAGLGEAVVLRLLRVYSGALRRMAQAEAEAYEVAVEDRRRVAGASEQDLLTTGGEIGRGLEALLERAMLALYRRHRQHVWLDHSVRHIELILEGEGLYERLDQPPCVCFVDLSGYTAITEEHGDEVAADLADRLAALVEAIAHRHDGRPVRWLGDGGMFVFREPASSVRAAVEMVTQAPGSRLPPTHIGVHCGPVVFQDGDIYGRTVNIAARLASRAVAGEILVSGQLAQRLPGDLPLEDVGAVELKGLAEPFPVFRVRATPP